MTLIIPHRSGKIAERIAANELEAHGFRVSDLNRDGISANADLLAAREGSVWQVQVKGSTNGTNDRWWVQYGFCNDAVMDGREPMFNRAEGFYRADIVVLVALRTTTQYRCFVLPVKQSESAAQINLDRSYRTPTRKGTKKKPHMVWISIDPSPNERPKEDARNLLDRERRILTRYENAWDLPS
jgi:hypothetical protein